MNNRILSVFEDNSIYYHHAVITGHKPGNFYPHYHDVLELLFIKSGYVSYEIGGEQYLLRKNALVLTRPNERHCITVSGDVPYERYNILFDWEKATPTLHSLLPKELSVVYFENNQQVIRLFEKMDYYCSVLSGEALGRVLLHLSEEVLLNAAIETGGQQETAEKKTLLSRSLGYIDEHLMTITGIEEICEHLYISKSHLHHLFMEQMSTTPKRYIMEKRLQFAKRELLRGIKATEVAAKCGFTDYSAFFRAYKKQFGHSPAQTGQSDCIRISFSDFLGGYPHE
jgi:AraC-like DNA-binding protein